MEALLQPGPQANHLQQIVETTAADQQNNANTEIFCQGIQSKKDLTEVSVQEGIKYIICCCVILEGQDSSYKEVLGLSNVHSIFP